MVKAYIAHPHKIRGTNEQRRLFYAAKVRGYEIVNPFAFEAEKYGREYYNGANYEHARTIVEFDIDLISKCKVIIAYCPSSCPTWGTPMEVVEARHMGKHVIVISDLPHPFLWWYSDEFYPSLDAFREGKQWERGGVEGTFEY